MRPNVYNSYMTVDLGKLRGNFEKIRAYIGESVDIMPVLKGDAYGLGGVELVKFYADTLDAKIIGVAHVCEAAELREAGIGCELLVLGGVPFNNISAAVAYMAQTAAFEREYVDMLDAESARQGKTAEIQIKINTGLNRIGLKPGGELAEFTKYVLTKKHIRIRGAFTHFSESFRADRTVTENEFRLFKRGVDEIKACGVQIDYIHACNSCASVWFQEARCNLIRPGNLLFGYDNNEEPHNALGLEPVVSWRCFITQIRTLAPGETVGYGGYFAAKEPMKAATVSVGFGDGYFRPMLMGKGYALVRGKRCRFLAGSMDQSWIDVSRAPDAVLNDEVTLLGRDGGEALTVYDWRDFCGESIVFLSSIIGRRVERVYIP